MKIHKLMELLLEMEEAMTGGAEYSSEEVLNQLFFWERKLRQAGYCFKPFTPEEKPGRFELKAFTGEEENRVCEVRVWDNREHLITSRYSLRRFVTEADGALSVCLPAGEYDVEVGCGPEFSICRIRLEVKPQEVSGAEAVLTRKAHFTDIGWVCGDLHHHSIYSSPAYGGTDPVIETPEEVCRSMKSLGMQFGALSDHHNTLNHGEWRGQSDHFAPVISKEISTSNGHVLQLGVEEDVIYDIPKGEKRTQDALRSEFIRVCRVIREAGGLPQINHPFDISKSTRYNDAFWDMADIFESMEIWNGATPMVKGSPNDKALHRWLELMDKGVRLTGTAGSDTHNIYGDDYFGYFELLHWMRDLIESGRDLWPAGMEEKTAHLLRLLKEVLPRLEEWVRLSNSPSNIHNYVYSGGDRSQEGILEAIRRGRVFVSNGPLIRVSVNGAGPGETAALTDGCGELELKVTSPRQIPDLWMYTGAEMRRRLPAVSVRGEEGEYCLSLSDKQYPLNGARFAVIVADGGENAFAVTNPIFFS